MKMLDEEEISLENRQKTTQNRNFNRYIVQFCYKNKFVKLNFLRDSRSV